MLLGSDADLARGKVERWWERADGEAECVATCSAPQSRTKHSLLEPRGRGEPIRERWLRQEELGVSDVDVTRTPVAGLFSDRHINVTAVCDAQSLSPVGAEVGGGAGEEMNETTAIFSFCFVQDESVKEKVNCDRF